MKKSLFSCFAALAISIFAGYFSLVAAYSIPSRFLQAEMTESAEVFKNEGDYRSCWQENSQLDNFTDAIILSTSGYSGTESVFEKAACSYRFSVSGKSPAESFAAVQQGEEANRVSYARYWHGYAAFVRPPLIKLNYKQIRHFLAFFQAALFAVSLFLFVKKLQTHSLAFVAAALFFVPVATTASLQFSNCVNVMLIATIFVLLFEEKLRRKNLTLPFFVIVGATTSFVDLLTFPTVTLTLPVTTMFLLSRKTFGTTKSELKFLFSAACAWLLGFAGMWATKWIFAFAFQGKDFVNSTIGAIKFRSSAEYAENKYNRILTLLKNIVICAKNCAGIGFSFAVVFCECFSLFNGKIGLKKNRSEIMKDVAPFAFIVAIPCIWIFAICNHATIHTWFTFRNFAPCVFAVLSAVSETCNVERRA